MNIVNKFGNKNMYELPNREISYIVIHYTAGSKSRITAAANCADMFNSGKHGSSSDFIVDDGTIVQYNPDIKNKATWHCGGNKYATKGGAYYKKCTNYNSIGIEVCCNNSRGVDKNGKMPPPNDPSYSFTAAAIDNTVELVKYLMKTYNVPAERVIRHYDVNGKPCPGIIGWNKESGSEKAWEDFKKAITATETKPAAKYYVQVGAFSSKANAEAYLSKVKKTYPDAFIKTM